MTKQRQMKLYVMIALTIIFNMINMPVGFASESGLFAKYTGPEGVTVYSYSAAWSDVNQLKELYNSLVENVHGSEISYLEAVKLMPGNSPYGASTAGMYFSNYARDYRNKTSYGRNAYIELYNTDAKTTVQQLAKTLAHEYGHHFTIYHLWMGEGVSFNNWQDSKWAKIRGISGDKRIGAGKEHQWAPEEIAAEDYVQLFGGPQARDSVIFSSRVGTFTSQVFNLSPQENLSLPLAAEIPGYQQYWEKLAGLKPITNAPPTQPQLALVAMGKGNFGSRRLTFSWHPALDDQPGELEYTLVYYRRGDTLAMPVETVVDAYSADFDYAPVHESGEMLFRVFVQDSEGLLVASQPVTVNLSDPQVGELGPAPLFRDVKSSDWFYEGIMTLYKQDLVSGYENQTFLPNEKITRAELTTLVVRVANVKPTTVSTGFTDLSNHWARKTIYAAAQAGLVGGYADGSFGPNRPVTRAELAVMIDRVLAAEQIKPSQSAIKLTDLHGHWAEQSIRNVANLGLMGGYQDGSFQPERLATRAETATVVASLLKSL